MTVERTAMPTWTPTDLNLLRMGARSALLGVAFVIGNIVTISLFFAVGQPWGTINDVVSVLLALTFILPVLAYRLIERQTGLATAAGLVALIGATGAIASTAVSVVVALGLVTFEATYAIALVAFGIIGAWLVLVGIVPTGGVVGRTTSLAAVVAGVGYMAATGASWFTGSDSVPVAVFGGIALVGQIGWGIGLGRRLGRSQGPT